VPDSTRLEDTLVRGYRQLALETPARPRDVILRALDVLLSSLFLLVSLPISLVIAAAVLVTSGTPILYRGERVGRGARVFTMYKFRTLRRGAERRLGQYLGEELVQRTQAEFTPIGKWLKATQLDEIPQFVNVLRGDMSMVGPRPIRRSLTSFAHEPPSYWQRLVVGGRARRVAKCGGTDVAGREAPHDLEWIATGRCASTCALSSPPAGACSNSRSEDSRADAPKVEPCVGSAGSRRRTAPRTSMRCAR
jgi:lipopolysaccharide/colanic/teichoic acid biosynthesis glycosyltransferase